METFDELLEESTKVHGHICPGQVLGVRLSMLGLKEIGISDPKGKERKSLYVIVEIDRCATDAIQSVTGCSLGKRSLYWRDNGIMAATFVNLSTQKAVRVTALEESRELSKKYCRDIPDKHKRQLEAYKIMPDAELFRIEHVKVEIPSDKLPGRPAIRIKCDSCGDWVQDNRHVIVNEKELCRNCAGERYYTVIDLNTINTIRGEV